jgi:hypothetical protein
MLDARFREGKDGDRDKDEEQIRTSLRIKFSHPEFTLSGPELDLARDSRFDEDVLVSLRNGMQVQSRTPATALIPEGESQA